MSSPAFFLDAGPDARRLPLARQTLVVLVALFACGGEVTDPGPLPPVDPGPVPVAIVKVEGPPLSRLYTEQSMQLAATTHDSVGGALPGRDVTWSSSHPSRADVDANGRVTGMSAGAVTITATSESRTGTFALTVLPAPVADWSRAADWVMFQGDADHSGYVAAVVDPRVFAERWVATVSTTYALHSVVAADGGVFASTNRWNGMHTLSALDIATGAPRWTYEFGNFHSVHSPAYRDGRVYVAATTGQGDSHMWAFDATTGDTVFRTPYQSTWFDYYAPVVMADRVYMAGGLSDGVYAFDASDGTRLWFAPVNSYTFENWTPALGDGLLYAYTGADEPGLIVMDAATGAVSFEIPDPGYEWDGWTLKTAPVLGGANNVLVTQHGRLISFDLDARSVAWSLTDAYRGVATVADGIVYIVNGGEVQARAESDGAYLWRWVPLEFEPLVSAVVATDNILFVSSSLATYAVDIASRSTVWVYPAGGNLALGKDGTLFIARANGTLAAVAVK